MNYFGASRVFLQACVWACVCVFLCFPRMVRTIVSLCVGGVTFCCVSLLLRESCRGGPQKETACPHVIETCLSHLHHANIPSARFYPEEKKRQEEESVGIIPVQRDD